MVETVVETITPKKAAEYLKHNTNNCRKIHRGVVKAYADMMLSGRWELNGEGISFGEDGKLKNGQHRLAAIIMANKPIEMLVTRGISNDVNIYDMGLKRTSADIINADGFECNPTIVAASRIIVDQFQHNRGNTRVIDYAEKHIDELNRAYRIVCYGESRYSHNAPCIAGCYLALRACGIPHYEEELFFRLFNDKGLTRCDGYDPSSVLIARQMFDERGLKCNGYQIQKERLEIICLAQKDFHEGIKVSSNYKIQEPFYFSELIKKVRKADGLEEK